MSKSLSIVIPVYNEEARLVACLESIAAQTEAPDEVIVIDNNSTDSSVEVAKKFAFVRLITEPKQGIVYARNTGFNAVRSDIIARIDADTVMPKHWVAYVKRFYDVENHGDQALTGGGYFYNIRLPRFNGWVQSQLAYRVNRFVVGHYVLWGSNMAMPAKLWPRVRDEVCLRNDIHEDLDLSFHLHGKGVAIAYRQNLRVGVCLKRVYFGDRHDLIDHMKLWPQTLKAHGYRHWWVGVAGNYFLWFVVQPLMFGVEAVARLSGKVSLHKKT